MAKWAASISKVGSSSLGPLLALLLALPVTLSFERVGDLAGHVGLVMTREDRVGQEHARGFEHALRHDPLPLPEQIRQEPLIAHRDRAVRIRDFEGHDLGIAAPDRALLHKPAKAEPRPRLDPLGSDVARGMEED